MTTAIGKVSCFRRERVLAIFLVFLLVAYVFIPRSPLPVGTHTRPRLHGHRAHPHLAWTLPLSPSDNSSLVHVVMATCNNGIQGVLNLLKSAVMFKSTEKICLHIVADQESIDMVADEIKPVVQSLSEHKVFLQLHPLPSHVVNDNDQHWRLLYKPCSATRLFLHELLVNLTQVLYVDTDTLFLAPPMDLWAWFTRMNSSHMVGLAYEHESLNSSWYRHFAKYPFFGQTGLNSGVMLMNLESIRAVGNWTAELSEILNRYQTQFVWGDQDVLNVYFSRYPDRVLPLPCSWNYRHDHCSVSGHCWEAGANGAALLHGNKGMFLNPVGAEFKIIYDTMNRLPLAEILQRTSAVRLLFVDRAVSRLLASSKSICGVLLIDTLYNKRPKNTAVL